MLRIALIIGVTVVTVTVAVMAWCLLGQGASTPRRNAEAVAETQPLKSLSPIAAIEGRTKAPAELNLTGKDDKRSPTITERPTAPPMLGDWYKWTESKRLEFVTNSQHNSHLPFETLTFFRKALFDRKLGLVTRNNMANCLVGQESHDPTLAAEFKKLVEDTTEDVQWRDYSLQFMAACIDWSDNPSVMVAAIWKQAQQGPGTISGTALLHLHYIDERGVCRLPYGYSERLGKCLSDPTVDLSTRMTAVGIIGQRQLSDQAQVIRNLAEKAPEPSLRRTALATLGSLGDPADLILIQRYTSDQDPLVAAAAKGAERRLSQASINANGQSPLSQSKL